MRYAVACHDDTNFITITEPLTMLLILSLKLSLFVMVFLALMILFITLTAGGARNILSRQQKYLGSISSLWRMVAGQKVEKVFSTKPRIMRNSAACGLPRSRHQSPLTYSGM